MRCGTLPNGAPQSFYFLEDHPSMPGWFKGMEVIIQECGLWPNRDVSTSLPSAQVFVALLVALTAIVDNYFFCSPILYLRSPSFKS